MTVECGGYSGLSLTVKMKITGRLAAGQDSIVSRRLILSRLITGVNYEPVQCLVDRYWLHLRIYASGAGVWLASSSGIDDKSLLSWR